MTLDFKQLIDVDQKQNEIRRGAQQIRNNHVTTSAEQYLHDLFDYFLKNLQDIADEIYNEALFKKDIDGLKFTALSLSECVETGTKHFLPLYNHIINGYSAGGMFREYTNFKKDHAVFKEKAEKLCKRQSKILGMQLQKINKDKRREKLNKYIMAPIRMIAEKGLTIAGLIAVFKFCYHWILITWDKLVLVLASIHLFK